MTARPRRKGVWYLLAALTALAVAASFGLRLAGESLRREETAAVPWDRPVSRVRLDVGGAEVSLGQGAAGRVLLRRHLGWTAAKPRVRASWAGTVLTVTAACGDAVWSVLPEGCGIDLDLTVPPGTPVSVEATSAEITARGLDGPLDVRTRSGNLYVGGGRGDISFRAGSGELRAEASAAAHVDAETGSGGVAVGFAAAPARVRARTGAGEVDLAFPPGTRYRLAVESGTGDRSVDPALGDPAAAGTVDARTGAGSVTLAYSGRSGT
ncbi:hypothetical protein [Actinomadura parmotrematis]|uniref:DUF4097 domain-containing protein n=1 Tax=Actinomadura parmotrematis TaxID=2864039 RepID=A0ABS7FY24_9ACTN|nr:hypothetical protein [Actinomadura parmotrematis]MBW8484875.1 hypothetical protein [Actinomadura parmotrematis]